MHKNVQITVMVALAAAIVGLMIASPTAAFAKHHHHHHHHGVSIHQSIHQDQSCFHANCQQNAANIAQVGHDNTASVNQTNVH
jgi:hypothetical protein